MFLHKEACDSDFWLNLLLTIVTVRAGCYLHGQIAQKYLAHASTDMCPLPCLQFWILGECLLHGVPPPQQAFSLLGIWQGCSHAHHAVHWVATRVVPMLACWKL